MEVFNEGVSIECMRRDDEQPLEVTAAAVMPVLGEGADVAAGKYEQGSGKTNVRPKGQKRKRAPSKVANPPSAVDSHSQSPSQPPRPRRVRTKTAEEAQRDQDMFAVLNDLKRFVKMGTIDISRKEVPRLTAPGMEAPDGWRWISPPSREVKLPKVLEMVAYLYRKLLARVTYMMIDERTMRLRIYMLPQDAEGRRCVPKPSSVVKKTTREVLELVNCNPEAWQGTPDVPFIALLDEAPKSAPSLFDMFNSITPTTRCAHPSPLDDIEIDEITREIRTGRIKGMRSTLYPYQQETVAEMLKKELLPEIVADPRFREMTAVDGTKFYLDTVALEVYSQTSYYDGSFGGVLAEEMGFGKTCICIALICATLHQGSRVPELYLHDPVTYTDTPPRLSQLCVSTITKYGLPWRYYQQDMSPESIRMLESHVGFYDVPVSRYISTRASLSRQSQEIQYKRVVLSKTTLVVCPDSLVHQWYNELEKHVEPGFLSVMVFVNAKKSGTDFEKYDVVLTSQRRFAKEFEDEFSRMHNIQWKRIIVDEGHSMGAGQTSASFAAKHLTVDRKWAVTGTPVPGLLGLNVGLDAASTSARGASADSAGEVNDQRVANPHSKDVSGDLARLGHIVVDFLRLAPWCDSPGMWSKYCTMPFLAENRHEVVERVLRQVMVRHRWEDLEIDVRIPDLSHKVVKLEPSLMNKIAINLFNASVAVNAVSSDRVDQDYLFHKSNLISLRRLVSNLQHSTFYWTGHEVEDIEHTLKVANECLVNGKAYTDSDRELLRKSIDAMEFALRNEEFHLSVKHQEVSYYVSKVPPSVRDALCDITYGESDTGVISGPKILHLQQLARSIKTRDVDGNVADADIIPAVVEEFSRFKAVNSGVLPMSGESGEVMEIDTVVTATPTDDRRGHKRQRTNSLNGTPMPLPSSPSKLKAAARGKHNGHNSSDKHYNPHSPRHGGSNTTRSRSNSHNNLPGVPATSTAATASSHGGSSGGASSSEYRKFFTNYSYNIGSAPLRMTADSELRRMQIDACFSSKLTYLLSRLMQLTQGTSAGRTDGEDDGTWEKAIVFYEYDDIAYYIGEALEIAGIEHCFYTTAVPPVDRAKNLTSFNTTDEYRVMLMDLNLAAHGLNVTAASRVFFMNPVWQPNIEAQAMRRAHRIGQTRNVYVETLVLKGTVEEAMFERRRKMTNEEFIAAKTALDDAPTSELISRAHFIEIESVEGRVGVPKGDQRGEVMEEALSVLKASA
ncbi:P-loop containing nucleoside triphosphate hydrolase protein [Myxozyma melibiosi]|uniref:P-loop containing nucleoside triphosphate hydrolase protein n=1 Tax=Myxozyma melibiosi TaxID=54550 RepID=A0ABR1FFR8_9ASCO